MPKVRFDLDANEEKAVRAFLKVAEAQKKTERQFNKTARAGKNASRGISNDLTNMVTGFLGATAVIAGVTSALRSMHEERKQGAVSLGKELPAKRKLLQLAKGDKELAQKYFAAAEKYEKTIPGFTELKSLKFVFDLVSAELFAKSGDTIASTSNIGIDPSVATTLVKKIQEIFGESAGSAKEIINATLAASEQTTADFNQMATNVIKFASDAKTTGSDYPEALALLASHANKSASIDTAATQIKALATFMDQKKILPDQAGMIEGIRRVAAKKIPDPRLVDYITSSEARPAFKGFRDYLPELKEFSSKGRLAMAATNTEKGRISRGLALARSLPELYIPGLEDLSEQRQKVSRKKVYGKEQSLRNSIIAAIATASTDAGESGPQRLLRGMLVGAADFLEAEPSTLVAVAKRSSPTGLLPGLFSPPFIDLGDYSGFDPATGQNEFSRQLDKEPVVDFLREEQISALDKLTEALKDNTAARKKETAADPNRFIGN